jgi:hypothetical protein
MPNRICRVTVSLMIAFHIIGAAAAAAAPITVGFTGTAVTVAPELTSEFSPGDVLTGTFTYDPAAGDDNPDSDIYNTAASGSATLGTYAFTFSGQLVVHDNVPFIGDGVRVLVGTAFPGDPVLAGDPVGGLFPLALRLLLAEAPDLGIDLTSGLPTPLPFGPGAEFTLDFGDPILTARVLGTLGPASVPEPGTLLLFAVAGIGCLLKTRQA